MAILYVFRVNDPNSVGPYPPSVLSSSWYTTLNEYIKTHAIASGFTGTSSYIFDDVDALTSFLSTVRLTDPALIADVNAWKTAHNVSYVSQYYTFAETTPIDGPTS